MALLEEARFRLRYDEEALQAQLKVTAVTIRSWRNRHAIPEEYRPVLLQIIEDRLRPDEKERIRVEERLDEILRMVRGIPEVRDLIQRYVGPLPGARTTGGGVKPRK